MIQANLQSMEQMHRQLHSQYAVGVRMPRPCGAMRTAS